MQEIRLGTRTGVAVHSFGGALAVAEFIDTERARSPVYKRFHCELQWRRGRGRGTAATATLRLRRKPRILNEQPGFVSAAGHPVATAECGRSMKTRTISDQKYIVPPISAVRGKDVRALSLYAPVKTPRS